MKKLLYVLLMTLLCFSCNSKSEKTEKKSENFFVASKDTLLNKDRISSDSLQTVSYETKTFSSDFTDFVPDGYRIFRNEYVNVESGDLNKDGLEDVVFLIKKIDSSNIVTDQQRGKLDMNRRGIIVLLKKADGYEKVVQNLDCFSSENEDGGIYYASELYFEIVKGKLKVSYAHGRYGYWSYTFRYQQNDLALIGFDSYQSNNAVPQYINSINFLTKKKLKRDNLNKYDPGDDYTENYEDTWEKIEVPRLILLSEIEDFVQLRF